MLLSHNDDVQSLIKYANINDDYAKNPPTRDVEDLIAAEPDSILIGAADGDAICPAFDNVAAAGIPIFTLDLEMFCDSAETASYNDSVQCATAAARLAIAEANRRNEVLNVYVIQGDPAFSVAAQRRDGFVDTINAEADGMVTTLVSPFMTFAAGPAADAVISAFPAHPELNAAYEPGGGMVRGVIEGLRTIDQLKPVGDPDHVWVVCFGIYPETVAYVQDELTVDAWAEYSPWATCDTAIKAQFKSVILGKSTPSFIKTTGRMFAAVDMPKGAPEWESVWAYLVMEGADFAPQDFGIIDFP